MKTTQIIPLAGNPFPAFALLTSALLILAPIARAQDTSAWRKAADNHIYAQTLVNETMARNPGLVVIGMHAAKPGTKDEMMIATNLDRVGKKDDDDDIAVATERKMILAPNLTDPSRFEVQVPMKDATGKVIGSFGFVFKYKEGDDPVRLLVRALTIRDELAERIPQIDALFAGN